MTRDYTLHAEPGGYELKLGATYTGQSIDVEVRVVTLARIEAVTDGKLDGYAHPAVVLLLMEVGGQPAFRCSGTSLSATVLLTAGHCTNNVGATNVKMDRAREARLWPPMPS